MLEAQEIRNNVVEKPRKSESVKVMSEWSARLNFCEIWFELEGKKTKHG